MSVYGLSVGIVGLPNVGKSTLFNALLKRQVATSANYPFTTIEPNVGVVEVPDERLGKLADVIAGDSIASLQNDSKGNAQDDKRTWVNGRPPVIPAIVKFVDIAGLVKGASKGEGLGNKFLSYIREVDAIVHVLRDFEAADVIRAGSVNPQSDMEIVETELKLADLEVAKKLLANAQKETSTDSKTITSILASMVNKLEQGGQVSEVEVPERLADWEKTLPLITNKPVIYVYNVSEGDFKTKLQDPSFALRGQDDIREVSLRKREFLLRKIVICAKLEEELIDLSEDERKQYLKELGLEESGLDRLIKKAYETLGLITFFTAGPKEVRAWTIEKGTLAPGAAGVIHSDFEKGFIAADVCDWQKLVDAGGWQTAKAKGLVRTIGKSDEIADGMVVEFRFSV